MTLSTGLNVGGWYSAGEAGDSDDDAPSSDCDNDNDSDINAVGPERQHTCDSDVSIAVNANTSASEEETANIDKDNSDEDVVHDTVNIDMDNPGFGNQGSKVRDRVYSFVVRKHSNNHGSCKGEIEMFVAHKVHMYICICIYLTV